MSNTASSEGGMDEQDRVELAALIIALVALLGTIAQVLQQYSASAVGYSNCGESVMGKWHKSKKRKFRAEELRFEVQFESPVFFVCAASNKNGPLKDKPIHFVDGTPTSLDQTRALLPKEDKEQQEQASRLERRVQTADNERASWVILLSHLQLMERESQEWQQQHYQKGPPQTQALPEFKNRTLAVAVQAKQRSWDTMPAGVKKPYATTTICHLIEIAAILGIYWKEFDRSRERYRAEGNGYFLMGTNVADLGVLFTLQICGANKFRENRVIPVDEVKELCCGFVSTLFEETDKDRRRIRVEFSNEDPKDLSFLQLGSMDEIAETMVRIECNTDTANYFRSSDAEHRHLFAVPFELLGMLGKTLHIRNSAFRMLPNPTPYHWDKNFFNLRRLVREYWRKISDSDDDMPRTDQITWLIEDAENVVRALDLDKKSKTPGYSMPLLDTLHNALDKCDEFLKASDSDLVRMVVREHFQEVLKLINDKSGGEGDSDGKGNSDGKKDSDGKSTLNGDKQRATHFHELTAASPEQRQEAFMDLYFFKVLRHVRERAVTSYARRRTTQYAPSTHSREPSTDSIAEAKEASPPASPSAATPSNPVSPGRLTPPHLRTHESGHSIPMLHIQPPGMDVTTTLESDASDVWCTLVFRMLCWLLLHDFNKKDVQIAKSELLGSRLPVYIA